MIKPRALACETRIPQLPANEIDPVQSSPAWIEPEDSNTEQIGTIDCFGKNAPPNKDETLTSVSGDERRDTLHEFQSDVASPVVDPTEIARGVQVARSSIIAGRDDGVARAEIDHPSATELGCLGVVRAPRHRFRKQRIHVHGSRLHPTAEIATVRVSTKS